MLRCGLFGIGLDTYWPQFEGLLPRLEGYQREIAEHLEQFDATVLNAGMVDTPEAARRVAGRFNREEVDLVVLFISTYALSHTVLPVAQRVSAPILVLNLQPVAALDYDYINGLDDRGKMTGEWLAHCQSCVAPEIASVFRRAGLPFRMVSGHLRQEAAWEEIGQYLTAARLVKELAATRVGVMGHYYNGMLDVYSDLTQLAAAFGCHFELREFGELRAAREAAAPAEISRKVAEFHEVFTVSPDCEPAELERAAATSVALDAVIDGHDLHALAYYYEGSGDPAYEDIVTSLIPGCTLLTGRHVPAAGECEVKNALAMKIMDLLGAGGSFSEFYAMDFNDQVILLGHDGPAHFRIADGPVGLVPLPVYHGKPGKGLSIQMDVRHGPVTLLSVCQGGRGEVYLLAAEGESVPGPTLRIGNTNSRYRFGTDIREWIDRWSKAGPSHHCAIGVGHHVATLHKLADLLGLDIIVIE